MSCCDLAMDEGVFTPTQLVTLGISDLLCGHRTHIRDPSGSASRRLFLDKVTTSPCLTLVISCLLLSESAGTCQKKLLALGSNPPFVDLAARLSAPYFVSG